MAGVSHLEAARHARRGRPLLHPDADRPLTSGAIQNSDPLRLFMPSVTVPSLNTLLAPKSASLTTPSRVMSTLAPLRSRWMILQLCRYSSPSSSCRVYRRTRASLKLPNRCQRVAGVQGGSVPRVWFALPHALSAAH